MIGHQELVLIALVGRLLLAAAAIGGAVYLARDDRDGWGWLIFLALLLGGVGVSDTGVFAS